MSEAVPILPVMPAWCGQGELLRGCSLTIKPHVMWN